MASSSMWMVAKVGLSRCSPSHASSLDSRLLFSHQLLRLSLSHDRSRERLAPRSSHFTIGASSSAPSSPSSTIVRGLPATFCPLRSDTARFASAESLKWTLACPTVVGSSTGKTSMPEIEILDFTAARRNVLTSLETQRAGKPFITMVPCCIEGSCSGIGGAKHGSIWKTAPANASIALFARSGSAKAAKTSPSETRGGDVKVPKTSSSAATNSASFSGPFATMSAGQPETLTKKPLGALLLSFRPLSDACGQSRCKWPRSPHT
mmetsp:Transcript_46872/g.124531  ORF Transcript_46872/g.124531 Transcript_46872/m.124531 type:complete len:264 (-) Transcript_46872:1120-1911(-)